MYKKLFLILPIVYLLTACDLLGDKAPRSLTLSKDCNIEVVDGKGGPQWTAKPGLVKIAGWAVDSASKTTPENLSVQLHNATGAVVALASAKRVDRPDVVTFFKEPAFQKAGFQSEIDASKLPAGEYTIATLTARDQAMNYCAFNGKLTLN
jgi:hypothetical protein